MRARKSTSGRLPPSAITLLRLALLICCANLPNFPSTEATGELQEKECRLDSFRLPRWLAPSHYDLFIKPDLNEFTFSGAVVIHLKAKSGQKVRRSCGSAALKRRVQSPEACRDRIVLHADTALKIRRVMFAKGANYSSPVGLVGVCRDPQNDLLVVQLSEPLEESGRGRLTVIFEGPIRDDLHGFYRSEHGSVGDEPKYIAVTQFQAPHARKAFPCFDEPDFKATFRLTMEHAAHLKAFSNTQPKWQSTVRSQHERVTFEVTPLMSTYLLAYAVGEFDCIGEHIGVGGARQASKEDRSLRLAICTPPGRAHEAKYALSHAARVYPELQDYFDIDQPLKKVDILSVRELDAGAMENWGLITFAESSLLVDEARSEPRELLFTVDSITHELSHQWFGNLVTMRWWDDLWLNEGFATWITQAINQQLNPEHEGELVYLLDSLEPALKMDARPSKTHPVRNPELRTAQEIEDSFDSITYEKAAAVIRMLNSHLGPEVFRNGIKAYISAHAYGNTAADDLWKSLEAVSEDELVSSLMRDWVDQAGFPLLRVRLTDDSRSLRITQERFLDLEDGGTVASEEADTRKWTVPVGVLVSDGQGKVELHKLMMTARSQEFELPEWFDVGTPGHWIKLNANFVGFYRVAYEDSALRGSLKIPIEKRLMEPADRLNIISDFRALYRANKLDSSVLDEVLKWYQHEDNDAVMNIVARAISQLQAASEIASKGFNRLAPLQRYYLQTGKFEERKQESFLRTRTRGDIINMLILRGDSRVIREAISMFERSMRGDELQVSFRTPLFVAVALAGDDRQLKRMLELVCEGVSSRECNSTRRQVMKFVTDRERARRIRRALDAISG